MELIFIRHGESNANIEKIFSNTGYRHGLTIRGVKQVNSLVDVLNDKFSGFKQIYTSPLKRAVETAEILSRIFGVRYEIDHRLIEFNVGVLEGKKDAQSWELFFELWKKWFEADDLHASISEGESLVQIISRIKDFIEYVRERYSKNSNVRLLVVCHGGILMSSLPFLLVNLSPRFRRSFYLETTDFISMEIMEQNSYVNQIYCTLRQ